MCACSPGGWARAALLYALLSSAPSEVGSSASPVVQEWAAHLALTLPLLALARTHTRCARLRAHARSRGRLGVENAHLAPAVGELGHALAHALGRHQVLHDEEVELLAEGEEVGEERVEVRLDGEVDDLLEVRVVEVGEDAEQVLVDVLGRVGERGREVASCALA